jgi:hypothetical protein
MIGKLLSLQMEKSIVPDISPKAIMIVAIALIFVILFTWKKEG